MLHCPTCGRHFADDLKLCPDDGTLLQADATVAVQIPLDPLIGRTFDEKYRLDERLGVGGMGTVYRATHLLIDRPVAIKVLNPRFVEDEAAQTRFRREARAAGRLQHANAVTVTDFGRSDDGYVYIVMELLEGRTLREVLAREAPLDTARAVALMLQTAAAVAAAHEAGIIHRDLKPANIFIVQRAHAPAVVKVLDFGIAKLAAEALDDDDHQTLTQVGVMIGTPRYMSPEQCDGAKLTPASDVYSLGVILYEMLTGTTPFSGSSPLAVALKHSTEPPKPPREFVSTIPPALEQAILHALEKKPEDRPPDAGAFRRDLYEIAERLGLEHAAKTTAPTIEALRNAGTETPSGRLIIDIERLRESRATAAPRDTTILSSTTAEEQSRSSSDVSGVAPEPVAASAPEPVSTPVAVIAESPVEPTQVTRINVQLGHTQGWRYWIRQPPVMLVVGLTLVTLVVALVAVRSTDSSAPASDANNQAQNLASPSPEATRSSPSSPSPESSPDETRDAAGRRKQPEHDERPARRSARQRQRGGPGLGTKITNKLKKIFKNPF